VVFRDQVHIATYKKYWITLTANEKKIGKILNCLGGLNFFYSKKK
jgi:hypothetical protein